MARPQEEPPEVRAAFGAQLEQLRGDESQASLARRLSDAVGEDIHQSSISNWELGKFAPPRRYVWAIEDLYRLTHGTLSRLLGYVSADEAPECDVPTAIAGDLGLTADQRADLLDQWERMRTRTAEQRQRRRRPPAP